ncbi:hypothetical protein [uncultured Thiodictyon sp.]|uniref:hypothetical protein n=1 Tax=uncultured Thiodictyon sp. TaxID=1846217 RepID=UPI0025D43341|nr:hypothetical protein [uncultured Thiodictyon sp.]
MPVEPAEVADFLSPFRMTESILDGIRTLIAAYRVLEEGWNEQFERLVEQSNKRLDCEPLLLPATFTNLCAIENENAVSDVLAEMLRLLSKSAAFQSLDLTMNLGGDSDRCPRLVEREWPVTEGHPNQSGRLDITAVYRDEERLVIEVKLGHADKSDLAKNEGYTRSLNASGVQYRAVALVRGQSEASCGYGFALCDWREVLLRFRGVIARGYDDIPAHSRLALLFLVGMLERRVLGLRLEKRLAHRDTLEYLQEFHSGGTRHE